MILETGSYTVDRLRLIVWASAVIQKMVQENIQEDLIKGNEYVITAEDVLKRCDVIPKHLIEEDVPFENTHVHHSLIKLVYKQPKEDDIKPEPNFMAIYNPYLKQLTVKYGTGITTLIFKSTEEWGKISFNADENNPRYLHVQIDYDETFQLLFYPRVDNNESLHENLGTFYNSGEVDKPKNIKIVHTDEEHDQAVLALSDYTAWVIIKQD